MEKIELPKEWVLSTLGSITYKPQYGYTTKSVAYGVVKFLRTTDITQKSLNWNTVPYCKDTPEDISRYVLKDGDLVISRSGSIGFNCLLENVPENAIYASYLIRFRPVEQFNERLIALFLRSNDYWKQVYANASGNAMQNINAQKLSAIKVIIPPPAEQKEIVRIVESHLQLVDQIKSRLDALPKILEQFRQSVLASAVSAANQEDQQTEEIYGKIFYFPKSWTRILLKEYCNIISGNAFKSSDFIEAGVPVIKISNIQYGVFEVKNQEYLPNSFLEEYGNFKIVSGDLLMALTRPITNNTLKICRYPQEMAIGLLNQRVCKFNLNEQYINSQYIEYLFQSSFFKNQVENNLSETLQPNLSPKSLSNFVIYLPSLEEQKEIVARVENLFTLADQIESKIKNAQERVNLLTQSILAKAFRGEFTAKWREENPDLISGENSAEALLKRIEEAKKAAKKKK